MTKRMFREVFYFPDLSDEAKEKARKWYRSINDYPFIEEEITSHIEEALRSLGYTVDGLEVAYSLSYSQGDGVSFSCTLTDKNGVDYVVTRDKGFHYVHEYTMDAYRLDEDGEEHEEKELLELMRQVAKKAKKAGYSYIEYEDSDENIDDIITVNEYTFTSDGSRLEADNA